MKRIMATAIMGLLYGFCVLPSSAQTAYWTPTADEQKPDRSELIQLLQPAAFRQFSLNTPVLDHLLEHASRRADAPSNLVLPLADGSLADFRFWETPVMAPELAAKFPDMKQYTAVMVGRHYVTAKLNLDAKGLHVMIYDGEHTGFIAPLQPASNQYIAFYKKDIQLAERGPCTVEYNPGDQFLPPTSGAAQRLNGTQRKVYRLAVATTGEYTAFHGGTVASAMSAILTTMNRVNGIYERELSVSMQLVANNDLLIYTNGATDPYTNSNGSLMLAENTTNLNSIIGSANYDIGHVFSTGGGGVATMNSVCGIAKARGVTGSFSPVGDPFDVDYVAHEIGHQFGANHTFNGTAGSCGGGNRADESAYEPGSGATIMSYAGICGALNLQANSDAYFHTQSLNQISNFITNMAGANCPVTTTSTNVPNTFPPFSGHYIIPQGTPFELTAPTATDATASGGITYCWEEWDLGFGSTSQMGDEDWNVRPIFRSFYPDTSATRVFPKMSKVLTDIYPIGEAMSMMNRTMRFILTTRDFYEGWGSFNSSFDTDTIHVEVQLAPTPFDLSSQLNPETWVSGETETITWLTAGTDAAPYNTPNVDIFLSVDGGLTFPIVLASNVPNNGSADIVVPFLPETTTLGRIKVKGVGNVFFQVNNAFLTIESVPLPIDVIAFEARSGDCSTLLSWRVGGDKQVDMFELQRSNDGKHFQSLATIPAQDGQAEYSYVDKLSARGTYQYRFALKGADGVRLWSPTRSVQVRCAADQEIKVFPNPVDKQVTVYCPVPIVSCRVVHVNGQQVLQLGAFKEGYHQLDMSGLASGIYLLQAQQEDGQWQHLRLVKQ